MKKLHIDELLSGHRYTVIGGVDGGIECTEWGGRTVRAQAVSARVARKAMREFRPPQHAQDRGCWAVIDD